MTANNVRIAFWCHHYVTSWWSAIWWWNLISRKDYRFVLASQEIRRFQHCIQVKKQSLTFLRHSVYKENTPFSLFCLVLQFAKKCYRTAFILKFHFNKYETGTCLSISWKQPAILVFRHVKWYDFNYQDHELTAFKHRTWLIIYAGLVWKPLQAFNFWEWLWQNLFW